MKDILEIIKQKDEYAVSIEISENSRQEPCVTIKVRSDDGKEAVEQAIEQYKKTKSDLNDN